MNIPITMHEFLATVALMSIIAVLYVVTPRSKTEHSDYYEDLQKRVVAALAGGKRMDLAHLSVAVNKGLEVGASFPDRDIELVLEDLIRSGQIVTHEVRGVSTHFMLSSGGCDGV